MDGSGPLPADTPTRPSVFDGSRALPADTTDGEIIQDEVYAVGKEHDFQPLRAWFAALYEVLLGASQGPRFGSFAAIYGLPETIELIEKGARGELAGA